MDSERYYIFCDESGNDNEHPVVGCVVVEKKKYDELLSIIKPKYLEYEKQNPKFEEIHFAKLNDKENDIDFTKNQIMNCVSKYFRFYSLILYEQIDNNNKKDRYYNIVLNKALEDFNIKQFQIEKIVIDKYKKQDRQKIGNFECCFIDSKYKISNSDYSFCIQLCDVLVGCIRHIKKNKNIDSDIRNDFCKFIKNEFKLNNLISINENWICKEYKKK